MTGLGCLQAQLWNKLEMCVHSRILKISFIHHPMFAKFWVTKVMNVSWVQGTWRWHKGLKPKHTFHSVFTRIHPSLLRRDGGRQNTPPHPESACLGLLVCGLGILSSTATSLEAHNLPRNPATVTPSPKQN